MFLKFKPEIKYNITLQSPSKSIWSTFKKAYLIKKNFKKFWKNFDKSKIDKELIEITNKFLNSESSDWVSKFWNHCQINHYKSIKNLDSKQLIEKNITDYARNVFFKKNDLNKVCQEININNEIKYDLFFKHKNLDYFDSISYNLATICIYLRITEFVNKYYKLINKNIYNNYSYNINIDDKILNQQLLFSLIELEKIEKIINLNNDKLNILEFGAGYGRTANLFLSLSKNIKYVIADIPPSIQISYNELKKNYPNKKLFYAFEIKDNITMRKALNENDVIFIFPHQLKFFDDKYFDLSLMIGITLEMEPKDVKRYMSFVNKLSKALYMKVFKYAGLPYSFYHVYRHNVRKDYFIYDKWKQLYLDEGLETDIVSHAGYLIT